MEETLPQPECFLDREEMIRRLPQLVFAASEACRRRSEDSHLGMAALPNAISARCSLCGFVLSGEELLALSGSAGANEKYTMLKRLRAGLCAREGCASSHYHLLFYNVPELNWSDLFSEVLTQKTPEPVAKPPPPKPMLELTPDRRIALLKFARVGAVIVVGLAAWLFWRMHTGGRIPILREPEHFRVTPSKADPRDH